jgi:tetratricopeptide (TPR) repeat protein
MSTPKRADMARVYTGKAGHGAGASERVAGRAPPGQSFDWAARGVSFGALAAPLVELSVDDLVAADSAQSSMPSPAWLRWLAPAIPVAAAFALALTRIDDPDAFTHLALGRHLVEQGGWPSREPFSFPSADGPYYNSEWLFDVVFFLAYLAAGTGGVVLLKAAVVALAVTILWLDSRTWGAAEADRPHGLLIRAALLTALVVMIRHRFVERPDIALMVFLVFTIYALNAYLDTGRRWIFALPVLQVVWANTHPSVIVGLVPFVAVLGGGLTLRVGLRLVRRWWRPAAAVPSWRQLGAVAAVLLAVLVASAVNPHRFDALVLPFTLADQPWFRQEILELQPPRLAAWPAPFAMTALLLVSFLATAARLPIIPALLALPFVHLGLSAVRFVFLLEMVAAPILARNMVTASATARRPLARRLVLGGAVASLAVAVIAVGITGAGVGPLADARKAPGFGINERWVPEGALRYLDGRGIQGRLFNAFHFGGYITWRDFPRRVPILDGRGHVAPNLLEEIHFARAYPQHLARLQAHFGLEVAVMDYPAYSGDAAEDVLGPDADTALTSPDWALVYWDDIALVYLRRGGAHAATIERDEYRHVKPANGAAGIARVLSDPGRAEAVRAELTRNVAETRSALGLLLLGHAAADPEQALAAFARVQDPLRRFEADQGTALVYWRQKDFARATEYYGRALAREPAASVLYNAGRVRVEAGDDRAAVDYLTRAQRRDPALTPVYPALIEAHRRLGDEAAATALGPAFLEAATRARVEQHERAARRLLAENRTAAAGEELGSALKLDPRSVTALTTLGYVRMVERRFDEAVRAAEAALAIDPRHAPAHRALAQIASARGDARAFRRHLEAFARLSPRSHDAWQARETLARGGPGD